MLKPFLFLYFILLFLKNKQRTTTTTSKKYLKFEKEAFAQQHMLALPRKCQFSAVDVNRDNTSA